MPQRAASREKMRIDRHRRYSPSHFAIPLDRAPTVSAHTADSDPVGLAKHPARRRSLNELSGDLARG